MTTYRVGLVGSTERINKFMMKCYVKDVNGNVVLKVSSEACLYLVVCTDLNDKKVIQSLEAILNFSDQPIEIKNKLVRSVSPDQLNKDHLIETLNLIVQDLKRTTR